MLTPGGEAAWRERLKAHTYRLVANIGNRPGPPGCALDHDTIGSLARARGRTPGGGLHHIRHGVQAARPGGDSPRRAAVCSWKSVGAAASSGVGEEVTRIAGTACVVGSMRAGLSSQAACEEAVRHIARLSGPAVRGMQVSFPALGARSEVGAFALLRGFTYAVSRLSGATELRPTTGLFTEAG